MPRSLGRISANGKALSLSQMIGSCAVVDPAPVCGICVRWSARRCFRSWDPSEWPASWTMSFMLAATSIACASIIWKAMWAPRCRFHRHPSTRWPPKSNPTNFYRLPVQAIPSTFALISTIETWCWICIRRRKTQNEFLIEYENHFQKSLKLNKRFVIFFGTKNRRNHFEFLFLYSTIVAKSSLYIGILVCSTHSLDRMESM